MRLAEDANYTRLPGSARSFLGTVQYWRGPDHLLLVEVLWLVERYRRFDFQDMVALTIQPTRRFVWMSLVYGALIFCFGGLGFLAWSEGPGEVRWVFGGLALALALMSLAALVWILARGPSCEVRLTTSVQTLRLPGLRSLRGARRFRDTLLMGLPPALAEGDDHLAGPSHSIPESLGPGTTGPAPED